MGSILGNRVVRVEDPRLLTAGGTYVEDIPLPDAAWVTYVRSPHAHARIVDIDTSDATAAPGVVAVFTAADLEHLGLVPHPSPAFPAAMRRPFLAIDVVRYVGEPVVAVVAEDRLAAADAADLVLVDYEPLPVVVDPVAALRDEVLLFPDHGTNAVMRFASSQQADFGGCEVVVEERIVNQRLTAAPIEGRSGAAYWTDDGRLVHYSACQGAHPTKALLAEIYGLAAGAGAGDRARRRRRLRRQVAHVPGGARPRVLRPAGRPAGALDGDPHREHARRCPTGAGRCSTPSSAGPATDGSPPTSSTSCRTPAPTRSSAPCCLVMTLRMATGVYDIDNVGFTGVSVVTNTVSTTAYRGAGRPEAAVAIERMVDRFAAEIGMDPAEVRRRNFVARFIEPYTTGIGTVYDVGDYPASLERALEAAALRRAARRAGASPGRRRSGRARHRDRRRTSRSPPGVPGTEFGCGRAASTAAACWSAAGRRRTGRVTTRRGR